MVQATYKANAVLLEEVGQFESGTCAAFRALQLLPDSRLTEDLASDGRRNHGSRVGFTRGNLLLVDGTPRALPPYI